ncbi:ciliary microtubule associated protein 1A [Latimeria chalumnae]|uniref:Outer dense fiber of sperm tails 3 n=1 Tax=Latimeria chalumnae TaxID=7897 RepID=H3B3W0_LATCH|nr:PREDICTED: outer dense fiber protein 3-like protein 1 [Latimeria chalumnae]|eukprot:XP_005994969.1 PREDICTED: outer dense fiber protein 3-like protein 1 [Latimeria chalumnae]
MATGKKPVLIEGREKGPGPGRYGLPSTVGYINHDFTKYTSPAYSFGIKGGPPLFGTTIGPGPRYLVHPKYTRVGKDGSPVYTLHSKYKDLNFFQPPGPGAYSPERYCPLGKDQSPAYSLSDRTRYRQSDPNPAANKYSVPSVIGPRVPHKYSYPCYSVTGRSKIGSFLEDFGKSPSPNRYKIPNQNVYDNEMPSYTMQARTKLLGDTTTKPGPGAHCPERVVLNKPRAPTFYMGNKHSEFEMPLIVEADIN